MHISGYIIRVIVENVAGECIQGRAQACTSIRVVVGCPRILFGEGFALVQIALDPTARPGHMCRCFKLAMYQSP